MIILGSYVYMVDQWHLADVTWIPILSIFLFTAASTIGYLIVPWVMIGELYPAKVANNLMPNEWYSKKMNT